MKIGPFVKRISHSLKALMNAMGPVLQSRE